MNTGAFSPWYALTLSPSAPLKSTHFLDSSPAPPHFEPPALLLLPEVPRWVTCRLLDVPVNNVSCSPDRGSGSVVLTCSCASNARFEDEDGFCLFLTYSSHALSPNVSTSLPFSLSLKEVLTLPPSFPLPSLFELFSPRLSNLHVSQLSLSYLFLMGNKRAAQRCSG